MELIATVLSLIGAVLNVKKVRFCFVPWMLANGAWIVFGLAHRHWGMVLTFSAFFVTSVWGWISWGGRGA